MPILAGLIGGVSVEVHVSSAAGNQPNPATHGANGKARARGLGLPLTGETGPLNAITDVAGVTVGFTTLKDDARSIRTGVTAILPRPAALSFTPFGRGSTPSTATAK